jgi:hypothetical protein
VEFDTYRSSSKDGSCNCLVKNLELISPAKEVGQETVKGTEVSPKEPSKFQVGDRVRVAGSGHWRHPVGHEFTVAKVDPDGDVYDKDGVCVLSHRVALVAPAPAEAPRKPQVGDTIEFLRNYANFVPKGSRIVVKALQDEHKTACGTYAGFIIFVSTDNIGVDYKLVSEAPEETPRKPQVGDTAVLLKDLSVLRKGERVEVTYSYGGGYALKSLQGCRTGTGWTYAEDLRLVA